MRGNIAKITVAYGNQLAGAVGGELSLGEIAQSGNTVCGRQSRQQSELGRRGVGCPVLAFWPESLTDPLPRATCRLFLCESDYVHEKKYCYGSRRGKTEGKTEIQVIEKKQVIRSMVALDAFLANPLTKRLYL